ncbi:MAG TPA: hypothetical protein VLR50_13825 [Desulfobacterales bacterium]|nr:hypothetical protein [Desulfobacterales bacterium]
MKRLLLALDGAFVLGLGLYMLFLSQTEAYSAFMNPKFRLLTAAAAVGLCIVGAAYLIRPNGRTDLLRTLCFAVLGLLILHAGTGVVKSSAVFAAKPPETRTDPETHVIRNGEAYLKSNPARLFLLFQTGHAARLDQRYVTRGIVKRSAQLDRLGRFALLRGNMVCCLADAIAMGVMVADDGSREFQDGAWVTAFGRAQATPDPQPITDLGAAGEVPFAMVYDQAVFVAEAAERIERPRFPFVFELPPSGKSPHRLTGGDDDY